MQTLLTLAMLLLAPQPLPADAVVGFKEGGHLVLTRSDNQWNFEYFALPKGGEKVGVPVETDKLHFVMTRRGKATLLTVTNGFKTGYRYKALIGTKERQVPTSTCTVMPDLTSFEHWPHEIDVMLLVDFEPSDELVCRK